MVHTYVCIFVSGPNVNAFKRNYFSPNVCAFVVFSLLARPTTRTKAISVASALRLMMMIAGVASSVVIKIFYQNVNGLTHTKHYLSLSAR